MPTTYGTPMHVGNPGDRTTPLPTTTWQPPTERPKFVWPIQEPIPGYQPPATEAPRPQTRRKRTTKTTKTTTPRKPRTPRPPNTCNNCDTTIARASTHCTTCSPHHRAPRTSIVDINTARTEYEAGRTCPEIAATHGWPVVSVRRQLKAAGVPMRDDRTTHSGGGNKGETVRPELPGLIRNLYLDQGMSQRQVAEWIGVTTKVVVHVMKRNNIPARRGQSGGGDTLAGTRDGLNTLGVTSGDIRTWARTQGLPVGVRGIVPTHLIDAYEHAQESA